MMPYNRIARSLVLATAVLVVCLFPSVSYGPGNFVFFTQSATYDDAGRLKTVVYGDSAAIAYAYDLNGNRTQKVVVGPDNPRLDSDTNGVFDLWELIYFQSLGTDPEGNADGDAMSNGAESHAWTDPTNAASYLAMVSISNAAGDIALRWAETHTNATYRLWWTDSLTNWSGSNSILLGAGVGEHFDASATNHDARFYRVSVEP